MWRACIELGVSVLHDVAVALENPDAEEKLCAAYADESFDLGHNYNMSILVCIPK